MATAPAAKNMQATNGTKVTQQDLEADVARLREDVSKLAEQLAVTGQHSYKTARRAASEGADQLRAKRGEAVQALRANADDLERQLTDSVREKPITSLAVAAGVGFLVALLTNR